MTEPYTTIPTLTSKDIERFWSKVDRSTFFDCWIWKGAKTSAGYGGFWIADKTLGAHRVAYYLHCGKDPADSFICHSCDNRICVNSYHLFIGTDLDNVADMVQKNRQAKGEKQHAAKLTRSQVQEIRERYVPFKVTSLKLAKEYGVTKGTILRIVKNRGWLD